MRHYPEYFLEKLATTTNIIIWVSGITGELRTRYLLNTGIEHYRYSRLFDKFLYFTVP